MLPFKISLTAKQLFYALIVIGVFITGWMARGKFYPCPEPEIINDTTSAWIPQPADTSGYEPQIIIFQKEANEDSIYQAAKEWWKKQLKPDTVYIAGIPAYGYSALLRLNKPNVKGTISFNSRIPLDPEGYFIDSLIIKEKTITQTFIEKETVTFNPDFFAEGSVRVNTDISYFIGVGVYPISYKHLESSIKAGAVYNKGWGVEAEFSTRIKF